MHSGILRGPAYMYAKTASNANHQKIALFYKFLPLSGVAVFTYRNLPNRGAGRDGKIKSDTME